MTNHVIPIKENRITHCFPMILPDPPWKKVGMCQGYINNGSRQNRGSVLTAAGQRSIICIKKATKTETFSIVCTSWSTKVALTLGNKGWVSLFTSVNVSCGYKLFRDLMLVARYLGKVNCLGFGQKGSLVALVIG